MSSVSFDKNGIVSAGGNDANPNMLIESMKYKSIVKTTYDVGDFNLSESMIANETYTISAHINTSSEKQSVGFFLSGGSISLKSWLPITEDGYYSATFTATSTIANNTGKSANNTSISTSHGFVRVYISNNTASQGSTPVTGTANVDWIKLEKSSTPTHWVQNENDYGYVGPNNNGFFETSNMMKIFDNHVETTEFIEY